ncbi:hypothetical protein [Salmonella enterica]|uniref:hypothetical protein n=1 Tax=Salmonella enterica TaxID=28901 RepID=UPI0009AA4EC2|nr:hypothetical protein [Salmonella enterica]
MDVTGYQQTWNSAQPNQYNQKGNIKYKFNVQYARRDPVIIQAKPEVINCGVFSGATTRLCSQGFRVIQANGATLPKGRLSFSLPSSIGSARWIDLIAEGGGSDTC